MKTVCSLFTFFFLLAGILTAQSNVCIPAYTSDCFSSPLYIDTVSTTSALINFTNNGTGCSGQDKNYTYNQSKLVEQALGDTFYVKFTLNPAGNAYFGMWIDWNNDGNFSQGESIYLSQTYTIGGVLQVNVPNNAVIDTVIMRLRATSSLPGACDSISGGETEDYPLIITTSSSSINENTSVAAWSLFPNPAMDIIEIETESKIGARNLEIADVLGNVIMGEEITGLKIILNISDLPAGIFLVRLNCDSGYSFKKFIHLKN